MQVTVSLALLVAGLIIVFGKYDDAVKKPAYGWIGVVLGYWLR